MPRQRENGEKAYLSVEEVAKRFGVNVSTVYRLVKSGQLPAFKVGSQWRFSESRLEQWIAQGLTDAQESHDVHGNGH